MTILHIEQRKPPFFKKMEIEAYEWFSKKNQMWHIKIQTDRFVYWYSRLTGTKGNAKAMAFYPFYLLQARYIRRCMLILLIMN